MVVDEDIVRANGTLAVLSHSCSAQLLAWRGRERQRMLDRSLRHLEETWSLRQLAVHDYVSCDGRIVTQTPTTMSSGDQRMWIPLASNLRDGCSRIERLHQENAHAASGNRHEGYQGRRSGTAALTSPTRNRGEHRWNRHILQRQELVPDAQQAIVRPALSYLRAGLDDAIE